MPLFARGGARVRRGDKWDIGAMIGIIAIIIGLVGWGIPSPVACNNPASSLQCQTAAVTLTNVAAAAVTITYPTAFKAPPNVWTSLKTFTNPPSQSISANVPMLADQNFFQPLAESFDKANTTGDVQSSANPFTFNLVITPAFGSEYAVIIIGSAISTAFTTSTITVSAISDSQGNVFTRLQSGYDARSQTAELELWTGKLNTAAKDIATVTLANPGAQTFNAGGTIALYRGVAAVVSSALNTGQGSSDSVVVTTLRPNDFVVGGSVLAVVNNLSFVCDTFTAGAGQTQRANDNTACAINTIVNYDTEDIQVAAPAKTTYATTNSGGADGDVIAAVDLMAEYQPIWQLQSSYTETFNNTQNEVGYSVPSNTPIVLHILCLASNPSAQLSFQLIFHIPGQDTVTSTIIGSAGAICTGAGDFAGTSYSQATPLSSGSSFWKVVGKCSSSCGAAPLNLEVTELSFRVAFTVSSVPVCRVQTVTATTAQIICQYGSATTGSSVITFEWFAEK